MNFTRYFIIYVLRPLRVVALAGLMVAGLIMLALFSPWLGQARRGWIIQHWSKAMLGIIGVRLKVSGVPPNGMALIVANHVSWIDPFLLLACHPMRFVAKAEIQRWPVLGWLTTQAGTVFIRRDRQRDLAKVAQIFEAHLHDGTAVGVFPESTTSNGRQLLPFKAALFQVAISTAADCNPVALSYDNVAAIWIEDMELLSSVWRVMAQPRITAQIIFCPAIAYQGQHRRDLASASAAAIATALYPPVRRNRPEILDDLPALMH